MSGFCACLHVVPRLFIYRIVILRFVTLRLVISRIFRLGISPRIVSTLCRLDFFVFPLGIFFLFRLALSILLRVFRNRIAVRGEVRKDIINVIIVVVIAHFTLRQGIVCHCVAPPIMALSSSGLVIMYHAPFLYSSSMLNCSVV